MTRFLPFLSAVLGAAFTAAVSLALGSLALRRLRCQFHRIEFPLFAFLSGAAALSLAVMLLCVLHQARLAVFLPFGLAAIAAALWIARSDPPRSSLPPLPRAWLILFAVVFAAFFLCYFSNAVAPEISPDGSSYHLGNVARDWRHHGFDWTFHSIYSSLPQGIEMLFLVAFSIGRHPAAALVHFTFLSALPLLIVCYGRRFGLPRAGACAALLVYACPVAGIAGISAYNDLAIATLVFAVFYLLQVTFQINCFKYMFLIGLFCGFSYAIKPTAGLALPFAALFSRGRRLAALVLGAALTAGPWLLRNAIWLHNPFAPFLNAWFPNPYWTAAAESQYLAGLRSYPNFHFYSNLFLQITVLGGLAPGMIGPVFLLLPLALLALRHPHGRRLLLAAAVFSIPAFLNVEIRFLLPALPFFALAFALALENSYGALPAIALWQSILCWPAILTTYCDPNAWRVRGFQLAAALAPESQTHFIASHVGDYALKAAIEQAVPPQSRIFSFAGRAAAYIDRDIVVGYESTEGQQIQSVLEKGDFGRAKSAGIGFLLVNDSDAIAKNLMQNSHLSGVTAVAKANETTLYRLD